jgi:ribosome recycling factor
MNLIDSKQIEKELDEALDYFKKDLAQIRSGKAQPSMIEAVLVEAYGGSHPLNTVGQVLVEDAMNIKVQVWDKSIIAAVEKALQGAQLGGGVAVDQDSIRIKFQPMTEEDRKARVKELADLTERYRIRVRQVRQKFMKELEGLDGVSEDDKDRDSDEIQSMIDKSIEDIDNTASKKEEELMQL